MKITFLYGSQTGTAEMLCDDMEEYIGEAAACEIVSLEDADPTAMDAQTLYVVVSATTGTGDVPSNAERFHDALLVRPSLGHVRFAIFGLGDQTFADTFNFGSQKLMTALQDCGAQMVGELGLFDAASGDMPEDVGIPWLRKFVLPLATS